IRGFCARYNSNEKLVCAARCQAHDEEGPVIRKMICVGSVALSLTVCADVAQWAQFRGAHAGVVENDPTLPDTWSDKQNGVWTQEIPGGGWSSPVVWDDHVFVTSAISEGAEEKPEAGLYFGHAQSSGSVHPHRWMLYDVDFQIGKIRWQAEVRRMTSAPPK